MIRTSSTHQVPPRPHRLAALLLCCIVLIQPLAARAHDPRLDLPDPQSIPEAWNVISASTDNVDKLIDANPLPDIAYQIANTSAPLRLLNAEAAMRSDKDKLLATSERLL